MNKIEFDNNIYAGYTNFNSLLYLNDAINEDMFDVIVDYIFYKLKYSNDKISDDTIKKCIDEYGLDLKVYDRVLEDKYDYFFEDYRIDKNVLTLERFNIVKQFINHSLNIAYLMSVKDHNINEHIARIKHNDDDDYSYQNDVDELYDLLLKDNSYSNAFDNMNKMINAQFVLNRINRNDQRDEIKFDEVELAIYLMIMHIKVMQYHRLALPIKHGHDLSDNDFGDRNFIYVDEYRELNEYSVVDSDYSIMGMLCEINFNFLFTTHF